MGEWRIQSCLLAGLFVILLSALACSAAEPTAAPTAPSEWVERTVETASYRVAVRIGPAVALEVMQPGAVMTMMDEGQAVNHHLEVHIFDRSSGAQVKTLIPAVTITDRATGTARGLANVQACLLANHRVTEPHFGDNLYLASGKYTINVGVGAESVAFEISP